MNKMSLATCRLLGNETVWLQNRSGTWQFFEFSLTFMSVSVIQWKQGKNICVSFRKHFKNIHV